MKIIERLAGLLGRGAADPDPDAFVEVARLPLHLGPMTLDRLRDEGFTAMGEEVFNVVTRSTTDYRILVPRHEADAALAAL